MTSLCDPLPAISVARGLKRLFPSASVAVFPLPSQRTHLHLRLGERTADVTLNQPVDTLCHDRLQIEAGGLLRQLYPVGWVEA